MDFSQHSCPSCLWQPNHDLCLQLALWGRVSCPSRSGRTLMVLVGMESWGLGLNLAPQPQEQRFFLTRSQQQWVFTCALGRHDFLFLPEWLRPFLLLMREEPGQEDASSPAFPTVAACLSPACLQTKEALQSPSILPSLQVFLINSWWGFWKELVSAYKLPQCLRLSGILHCHVSPSLTFLTVKVFVHFLLLLT